MNLIQLKQISDLIIECEKIDEVLHPVQFDKSINYYKNLNDWFLYYQDNTLVGLISAFGVYENEIEISACVKYEQRRKGIFSELLQQFYTEYKESNLKQLIMVNNRKSEIGKTVVLKKGFDYKETEYSMIFDNTFKIEISKNRLEIREATIDNISEMINVSISAFEESYQDAKSLLENNFNSDYRKQYIAVLDDKVIGICAIGFEDDIISINNFAIEKAYQGKGYAKEFLANIIDYLKPFNKNIVLDVNSNNHNAYNLYLKSGFKELSTIDYYEKNLE